MGHWTAGSNYLSKSVLLVDVATELCNLTCQAIQLQHTNAWHHNNICVLLGCVWTSFCQKWSTSCTIEGVGSKAFATASSCSWLPEGQMSSHVRT